MSDGSGLKADVNCIWFYSTICC